MIVSEWLILEFIVSDYLSEGTGEHRKNVRGVKQPFSVVLVVD
jgi:hypothetical protein